jgi:hypothetical protein
MGNNPCSTRFPFSLAGNGKSDFIAIMANWDAFIGFLF